MLSASSTFLTANALTRKQPIWIFSITGYGRTFSNHPSYGTDWIEDIADLSTTVSDLDGGADLGTLTVTVQDNGAAITGDFPSFVFEGKTVTLKTGFAGMSAGDFLIIFTGVVDTVASSNSNTSYDFNCTDNLMWTTQVIFKTGDDGFPTDSSHPKTLNGHPLDILVSTVKNELGKSDSDMNEANIFGYRDSTFAGLQFLFHITSPPAARDFIEQQIMQPLGGYIFTNAAGQLDVHFSGPKIGPPAWGASCCGGFADATGQIIGAPFLIGLGFTLTAPPGTTQLLLGTSDNFYSDNGGFWDFSVHDDTTNVMLSGGGLGIAVSGNALPWAFTGGINSAFPNFNTTGSVAPQTIAITAGHQITVKYTFGTVTIGGGSGMNGPLGVVGSTPVAGQPAYYVFSPQPIANVFTIDTNNTIGPPANDIPVAGQADLVNQISIRFDEDGGSYKAEALKDDPASISLYTQYGQHIIQSDGMRSGLQGYYLAGQTANLIFQRYGSKNLKFDNSVVIDWTGCVLEPGDVIAMTNPFIPDRKLGVRGITNKLFEVLDRAISFQNGTVTLTLLDTGLNLYKSYYIAPVGEASYTSASTLDKGHYMFICDGTDKYSNGDAANVLS